MEKYIVFKETWDYIDDNYKSVSKREVCLVETKKAAMAKAREWAEEKTKYKWQHTDIYVKEAGENKTVLERTDIVYER